MSTLCRSEVFEVLEAHAAQLRSSLVQSRSETEILVDVPTSGPAGRCQGCDIIGVWIEFRACQLQTANKSFGDNHDMLSRDVQESLTRGTSRDVT